MALVVALVVVALVVVALVIGTVALVAAPRPAIAGTPSACADGPRSGTPRAESAPGITRVDFSFAHRVAGRCRVLVTEVRTKAGTTTARPLLLAIHGADGDPGRLAPLLDVWADAGYVVAAPTFLKTKKNARGKALSTEVAQQASDARFVLDEILDRADDLHVEGREVGVAGMSLGGMTVYGLISHTCCRDGRIQAAIVMAGVHDDFPDGKYVHQRMPVLLVQGDADIGYHHSRDAYPQLAPPKWFITLHGERHSPPFEVPRGKAALIVDTTTTAFWNRYLKGERAGAGQIVQIVRAARGKATLKRDLSSG
jgi:dienelactone hydrolase